MYRKSSLALLSAALLTTTLAIGLPPSAQAFGPDHHLEITREGLGSSINDSFLRTAVRRDINHRHKWMDAGFSSYRVADDEKHFDDCEFDGAAKFIRDRYRSAGLALIGRTWAAPSMFGDIMHTVQDFYSHSNWVELGFPAAHDDQAAGVVEIHGIKVAQSDLVDLSGAQRSLAQRWFAPSGGQVVRGDILLGGDDWAGIPEGWRIARNDGGLFVPTLISPDGTQIGRLLETGRGGGDHECSVRYLTPRGSFLGAPIAYTGIRHDVLNKDCPECGDTGLSLAKRDLKYRKARALATLQTGYEWCRLVREAALVNRDGLLLATWIRAGGNPHPPGTPCRAEGPGPTPVVVTIESVRILNTGDGADAGQIQLAAVLYDDPLNFRRSVHVTNRRGRMLLRKNALVPASQLPAPLSLCVRDSAHFTLHAWDNDEALSDEYGLDYDDYGDDDELLVGFQRKFDGSRLPSGVQVSRSADLEVRYRVSQFVEGQPTRLLCPRSSLHP
ncbi:hypothetical protein [Nonomuraea sp. NPDC049141]|uniref:hypothetical protein n=1 Tax=Nonomuraea sp. NPDC049141 TaxID=3155500 RepID=UPI00340BC0F1